MRASTSLSCLIESIHLPYAARLPPDDVDLLSQPGNTCLWLASNFVPDFPRALPLEESDRILIPLPSTCRIVAINKIRQHFRSLLGANRLRPRRLYQVSLNTEEIGAPPLSGDLRFNEQQQRLPLFPSVAFLDAR